MALITDEEFSRATCLICKDEEFQGHLGCLGELLKGDNNKNKN
jgi:hypothetical protein